MVIHLHEASFSLDFRLEKVEVHGWGCQRAASPRGAPCLMPSRIGYSEVLFCPRLFIMRQKMQLTLNGLGHWPRLPFSLLPLFPCERIVKKETQNQACRGAEPSVFPSSAVCRDGCSEAHRSSCAPHTENKSLHLHAPLLSICVCCYDS